MKCLAIPILAAALAGCAGTGPTPNYDLRFGDAVRQARALQTLDADAGSRARPALGLDGRAAEEGMKLYRESFRAPPPVVNVINIGAPSGGAAR